MFGYQWCALGAACNGAECFAVIYLWLKVIC
jgi:hypothetical protein